MKFLIYTIFFAVILISAFCDAAQVTFTWNPNTETDLAGYKLYQGGAPGTYASTTDVGNVTQFTMAILPDTDLYFALTAYDTFGNESGFSDELKVRADTPVVDTTAPGAITSFTVKVQVIQP